MGKGEGTSLVLRMLRFRQIRAEELRTEAAAIVAERRGAVLDGLKLQASLPGVFTWLPAPPPAGQRVTLAYNKGHGSLRCVRFRHWLSMVCACVQIFAARGSPHDVNARPALCFLQHLTHP